MRFTGIEPQQVARDSPILDLINSNPCCKQYVAVICDDHDRIPIRWAFITTIYF